MTGALSPILQMFSSLERVVRSLHLGVSLLCTCNARYRLPDVLSAYKNVIVALLHTCCSLFLLNAFRNFHKQTAFISENTVESV